jgi:hypothetical protein
MKKNKKVYAHLLTWFQTKEYSGKWEMWNSDYERSPHDPNQMIDEKHRDLAVTTYPLTDAYDTNDEDIIEYQLLQMKMAGIDGVIVDWDGRNINRYRHEGFMSILKQLHKYDMKLIVCFEEWAGYWPIGKITDRNLQIQAAIDELKWLYEEVISKNDYEVIDQSYPILVFRKIDTHWFNQEEWAYIKEQTKVHHMKFLFNDVYDDSFNEVSDGYFTWVSGFDDKTNENTLAFYEKEFKSFMAKYEERNKSLFFGSVMPGFDDSPVNGWGGGNRIAPRYSLERYQTAWNHMNAYDVDFVQIVTWNDWNEGSQIEPCETYQYMYLEETIKQVSKYKDMDYTDALAFVDLPLQLFKQRKISVFSKVVLDDIKECLLQRKFDVAKDKIKNNKEKN